VLETTPFRPGQEDRIATSKLLKNIRFLRTRLEPVWIRPALQRPCYRCHRQTRAFHWKPSISFGWMQSFSPAR